MLKNRKDIRKKSFKGKTKWFFLLLLTCFNPELASFWEVLCCFPSFCFSSQCVLIWEGVGVCSGKRDRATGLETDLLRCVFATETHWMYVSPSPDVAGNAKLTSGNSCSHTHQGLCWEYTHAFGVNRRSLSEYHCHHIRVSLMKEVKNTSRSYFTEYIQLYFTWRACSLI